MALYPELFEECRVVRAHGELDLTTAPAFARDLKDACHGVGRLFVVVDLRGVTFMDGSVLNPLCAAWAECRERRGWIRVVHPSPGPALVIRAAGLLDHFPPYANAQDAWQGVRADRTAARQSA